MADSSNLKSDAIMEQMKQHFATDAGKKLTEKIGLVYQFHIAPKVTFLLPSSHSSFNLIVVNYITVSLNGLDL